MKKLTTFIFTFLILSTTAFAYSGDISINSENIKFSNYDFLEGRTVRIYATTQNNSNKDLLGIVRFYDNDSQISGDQVISIFAGATDGVFVDWTPYYGSHKIAVKIFPWEPEIDDPSNNWIVSNIYAVQDTDHDGIPNDKDEDDDGDNISDEEDAYPLDAGEQYDTDGDSIGDNADLDDDNDEVPDEFDDLPLDPDETIDTDSDGIGNIADTDDDGDGISDTDEENSGTNPLDIDTDKDGTHDNNDVFPINSEEWIDTDNDKIGNNTDIDDDNDGIHDKNDEFPLNKGPVIQLEDEDFNIDVMEELTFDASPSYDEDGKIVTYLWEIDGVEKEGNSVTHKFKELGDHNVKLTITDDSGESRTSEYQVNVMNIGFYKLFAITFMTILLALIIYFKYITRAKKYEKRHTS